MRKLPLLVLFLASAAFAESPWYNPYAISTFGDVQLAAATATLIPAAPTNGRAALSLQNLDGGDVFCGGDSTVTNTHFGLKVFAGTQATVNLSYNSQNAPTTRGAVYCYSVAGMAAANLHYWEIQ